MKSVLIIAYYFPPLGGGSVHRTLKHVKYLPAFGWRPIVLTASNPRGPMDAGLLDEIPPEAVVARVPYFEPGHLADWAARARARLARFVGRPGRPAGTPTSQAAAASPTVRTHPTRSVSALLDALWFPDRQAGWLVPAYLKGSALAAGYGVDVIYSSYNPATVHLVAGLIKRRTGIPWIADFRDPWLASPLAELRRPWQQRAIRALEAWTLRGCDHVTAVNSQIIEEMQRCHHLDPFPQGSVIPNGFDPEDLVGGAPAPRARFTLLYAGILYPDRDPAPLMAAVHQVLHDGLIPREDLAIRFVGPVPARALALAQDHGLAEQLEATGQVGHREAIAEMQAAHLLFLTVCPVPASACLLTVKVFEYLAVGRPILYIGPPSPAADLLGQAEGVHIVPYDDIAAIKAVLVDNYRRYRDGRIPRWDRSRLLSPWSRAALTGRLAGVLEQAAREGQTSAALPLSSGSMPRA